MKKILVIDDEENICRLYKEELEDLGYAVVTVDSGAAALAAMDRERFDLATLDMRMQGMDGIETLRKMKEKNRGLPVIISSAYEGYKDDFGSWASEAYIVKSADTTALKEAVRKILG